MICLNSKGWWNTKSPIVVKGYFLDDLPLHIFMMNFDFSPRKIPYIICGHIRFALCDPSLKNINFSHGFITTYYNQEEESFAYELGSEIKFPKKNYGGIEKKFLKMIQQFSIVFKE